MNGIPGQRAKYRVIWRPFVIYMIDGIWRYEGDGAADVVQRCVPPNGPRHGGSGQGSETDAVSPRLDDYLRM